MPSLLTSLFSSSSAARTGWFPIAGMRSQARRRAARSSTSCNPSYCGGGDRPAAQGDSSSGCSSQAMGEVVGEPFVLATLARGVAGASASSGATAEAALRPIAGSTA